MTARTRLAARRFTASTAAGASRCSHHPMRGVAGVTLTARLRATPRSAIRANRSAVMGRIPSPEEQAQGVVKIRDMRLRSELTVDLDDLAKELTAQLP